ncbi:MAG: ABC transporter transmembrane domain-containing protein [Burkholderiaceae bacterium]
MSEVSIANATHDPVADLPKTAASQSSWSVLTRLLPYLGRYRGQVALAGLALLVAAGSTLIVPLAFRQLIDLGFVKPELGSDPGNVNFVFLGLFGVAVVLAVSTAVRFYCVSWLGERISHDLRIDVYGNILRQDPTFFETLKSGEVLSRLSTDTTLIQTLVGTSISLGLRNTVLFIGSLAMMIVTSPVLASVIVGLLLVVVLPILLFGRKVRRLSRDSQDKLADTGALAGETLNAMQIVQAFVRESMELDRYASAADVAFATAVRRNRSRSLLTVAAITLIFGAIVFVLWLGAHAVLEGRMSPGLLTQFILYAALVAGSTGAIAEVLGDVQRAAGASERLLELLEAKPVITSGQGSLDLPRTHGVQAGSSGDDGQSGGVRVVFENLTFFYPSRPDEAALQTVNIEIERGQTVALVGPSGAGKTTLFQLLLRFYDPSQGEIRIESVNIRDLKLDDLRTSIGLVSQDNVVFSASARDNIRYGRLDATDAEVYAAAKAARVDEFVQRLPDGYDTYLGERGVRLSGGQRQRIAIARALLKNPPLLLLDEATSALDAESERAVQQALGVAMRGRTTLVIAHRLATIVNADKIIVLESGRVVESGTHDQLLADGALYARLAAMQFDA